MTINQRVEKVIEALGMQKKAFATAVGIDPASLSRIINGRSEVTDKIMNQIIRTYNVDRVWLESGNSDIPEFNNANKQKTAESIINYKNQLEMDLHSMQLMMNQMAMTIESLKSELNELKSDVSQCPNFPKKKSQAG